MGTRTDFQTILETIIGNSNVYFQPPANVKMQYPAIVYARDDAESWFADNSVYRNVKRYQVTIIDRNPDSTIPSKIASLPLSTFLRFYTADNLNHDVFGVYY